MTIDSNFLNGAFPGMFNLPADSLKESFKFPAPKPVSRMKQGALIYVVKGNFENDNKIDFAFDIAVGEVGVFEGKLLIKTLTELADLVESIVMSFET
jgi:hypothetical protein